MQLKALVYIKLSYTARTINALCRNRIIFPAILPLTTPQYIGLEYSRANTLSPADGELRDKGIQQII